VGEVVEDEDEVRLDERRERDAHGVGAGSGTVGSKTGDASYARAPTAPPVKRGMPSVGTTARGTNARSAASGSGASTEVTGRSGAYAVRR
jgi:hypothetical protein